MKGQRSQKSNNPGEFDLFGAPLRIFFIFLLFVFMIAAIFSSLVAIITIPFGVYPYLANLFWRIFGIVIGILFLIWVFGWAFESKVHIHTFRLRNWDLYNHGEAEEILRMRYARGEIPRKEFEEMLNELRKSSK